MIVKNITKLKDTNHKLEGTHLFRYETFGGGLGGPYPYLYTYKILRRTPKGYWIEYGLGTYEDYMLPGFMENPPTERFVLGTGGNPCKRFAYPNQLEAIQGYIARRNRYLKILTGKINSAKSSLVSANKLLYELKGEPIPTGLKERAQWLGFLGN